ncbi:MAG: PAS domain S-box protein, partial [Armatimonadetes bacterium]|nr:PAS domain S-box protein [Armatimonadota bacterium]
MESNDKTREQLLKEIDLLKIKISELEKSETERKRAEEMLLDSWYMLQTVLDSIPAAVFWKDRDLIYLGGNRTWLEAVGLKSSEEVVGKSDYDLPWKKNQADSFREYDRRVMESGIPEYDIIEPYLRVDGSHAWAKTNKVPVRDTEGNVIGVLGTYEDITERKQAEEELQNERYFSQNILDTAQAIILLLNVDGKIISINPYMEHLTGYSLDEVKGKDWFTTFLRDCDYKKIRNLFKTALKNSPTKGNINPIITKDGREIFIEWYDNVLKNNTGNIIGLLCIGQDITQRKQTEEALKENKERYRQIYQFSPDSIIIHDMDMNILDANSKAVEEFGYSEVELLKMTIFEIHPEIEQKHSAQVLAAMNKKDMLNVETKFMRKDGSVFLAEATPCKYTLGSKPIIHVVIRDITERKKVEEALKDNEEKLNAIVNNSFDLMTLLDLEEKKLVWSNNMWQEVLGWSPEKIIDPLEPCHPDDREKVVKAMTDILQGRVQEINDFEYRYKTTKGIYYYFTSNITRINIGSKYYIFIDAHDITERKQAEKEIKEKSIEMEKQFERSEKQRIATLAVLSDLNESTKDLKFENKERKQAEKTQKTLFNISNALNTTDNMHDLYSKIREFLGDVIDTTNFYVALYDENTNMISLPFDVDEKDDYETFPAGKTLTSLVIKTGKSMLVDEKLLAKLVKEDKVETIGTPSEIWLGVPLKVENKVIGVIAVQSYDDPHLYTEKDIEILTFVSEEIALAIKHKQAEENIHKAHEELKELHRGLEIKVEKAIKELREKDHIIIQQSR